jgi:predicted dehydrogenase
MAEGVELLRAFEKSNSIYFLAENYPQMIFNREIKRVCDSGVLGKLLYAEGEYNHPGDPREIGFKKTYNYFPGHWRNYLPRTYYVTHSLGPIMNATGATPKRVSALAVYAPFTEDDIPTASRVGDRVAIITTQNDDGSVFRFTGCATFGGHHNAYRVCGTEGQIENIRGLGGKMVLHLNKWSKPEDREEISMYDAKWNDADEELIKKSGHGGGDYLTVRMFLECIEAGEQPPHPFDVYSATVMSSVCMLAHRSALEGGTAYDVPDFRNEEDRKKYENDYITPFPGDDGTAPTLPCCSKTDYKATEAQLKLYREALENS